MIQLFTAIPNVVYGFANLLKNIYIICLWIGWAITTVIVGIIRGIVAFGNYVLAVISVLCEDFLAFLEDVGEVVERLLHCTVEAVCISSECLFSASAFILFCCTSIPSALYNGIMSIKVGSHIFNFIVLVKDGVLLLGICIWEVFALIFTGIAYLNEAPYLIALLIARVLDSLILDFLSTVQTYWFRSICGLCMGYGSWVVVKSVGLLPEENAPTLLRMALKYMSSKSATVGRHLLLRGLTTLRIVKSILTIALAFFYDQTQTLKTGFLRMMRELVSHTPTKAALQIKLEKEKASTQCVVCMDRRRDVMILNCRHLLMCRQCALTVAVNTGACPVCRSPIDNIISVYT